MDAEGRAMKRLLSTLLLAAAAAGTSAHVGDNNSYFRGDAGPWPVQVTVRHPGVVPGLADIIVRVEGDVRQVSVRPVKNSLGLESAPRPDVATPVAGSPGLYTAQLWFMERGAYSVQVLVDGAAGAGSVLVPVNSVATERIGLSRGLTVALIALGLFLTIGLVTIVRAAVRDSVLPPGVAPGARANRRGWIGAAAAVAVVALILWGGASWWDAEDAAYQAGMWRPYAVATAVAQEPDARMLTLRVTDERWTDGRTTPLIPDHGKLMHMFLVRVPAMDAFAHVHPETGDATNFSLVLPPLPAGRYAVYGDVVHESGFAQTLVDTVDVPAAVASGRSGDDDDSWWLAGRDEVGTATSRAITFADGSSLTWERPAELVADRPIDLRFRAREPDGSPARLEYYMGMLAHAAVRRDDGAVFVHLHPTGTIAMAAQERLTQRLGGDADPHAGHDLSAAPVAALTEAVGMPYAFPQPGRYRIWVQVRRDGVVHTAAWDADVAAR
jgi:hypothetical protein